MYCLVSLVASKRTNAEERNLFVGRAALLLSLGDYVISILFIGIPIFLFWFRKMYTKYIITTQRIKIERGLLSKSRNNIELFRIDDYEVKKPIGMRIVGHSILLLKSSDRNMSDIKIKGIPKLEQLAEELRECGLRERQRRGIKVWANA